MGMYDSIYVKDLSILPLTEREREVITPETEWQTKCLDCVLQKLYLNPNGRLETWPADEAWEYHGYVNFYTGTKGVWIEFVAKFTNGKMVSIDRVAPETNEHALW